MKQCWPAPERNKAPILEVLARVFPADGHVLEVASGSGQHAAHFARALPGLRWQPSDVDDDNLASIAAWVQEAGLDNLELPLRVDVLTADWNIEPVDAVFCANMIHIAPWRCAEGLLAGVGRYLRAGGYFVLYGPFRLGDAHTSPSNEAFDQGLRRQDPAWGVRDLETVVDFADKRGLAFVERVAMPANNQSVVFRKRS